MERTFLPDTDSRRRLYLMRHGHVNYFSMATQLHGVDGVPLTDKGREEAEAAGIALSHIHFDRAICSGLARARQTAEIVLGRQDALEPPRLEADDRIREIRGGGGRLRASIRSPLDLAAELAARFEKAADPDARMGPDGEKFTDAYGRAVACIEQLFADPEGHTFLVVAHEGINRLILGWATGAGLIAAGSFEQDTACINVIDFDVEIAPDGHLIRRRIIKAVNLTPYNYLKHGMNKTSLEAIFSRD